MEFQEVSKAWDKQRSWKGDRQHRHAISSALKTRGTAVETRVKLPLSNTQNADTTTEPDTEDISYQAV